MEALQMAIQRFRGLLCLPTAHKLHCMHILVLWLAAVATQFILLTHSAASITQQGHMCMVRYILLIIACETRKTINLIHVLGMMILGHRLHLGIQPTCAFLVELKPLQFHLIMKPIAY